MAKSLVVVESLAKAKTINKFLGKGYMVKASLGHVRDLPQRELGVDVERDFKPKYVTIRGKGKVLREIREAAQKTDGVYLALDPDREGEAIAWHISREIERDSPRIQRIRFNEITRNAIETALANPQDIDMNLVNAQQARRIVDRLVGYQVSPILWKTIFRGLSAGRVQSVALRLICGREREIEQFIPQEYWTITALLEGALKAPFEARLLRISSKKCELKTEDETRAIVDDLKGRSFRVSKVQRKERVKRPPPPFITSTLQQEASKRLGFSTDRTMTIAQQLYEGVDLGAKERVGLITYMRTDSPHLAQEARTAARDYIRETFGERYCPLKPWVYKAPRGAQEAHEAVRPTSLSRRPEVIGRFLSKPQRLLYELIWNRFLASQMSSALYDATTVDIEAGKYLFRATGSVLKFDGFLSVYRELAEEKSEEISLPPLSEGESLNLLDLIPRQHFTKPPPRYTEASLVKELEELGIGRPSTYSQIVSTILARNYAQLESRRFAPTELGRTVNKILVDNFASLFDVSFTAKMEEELDRIESGRDGWLEVVRNFYGPFSRTVAEVNSRRKDLKSSLQEETEIACDRCDRPMVIKWGKNGRFLACSGYPDCKNTRPLPGDEERMVTDHRCDECGAPMVVKTGKYGRFLACSAYPTCKNTKPLSLGVACPQEGCDGTIVEKRSRRGKVFYGCSRYPTCKFATWDRPVAHECPACGSPFMVKKATKAKGEFLRCLACRHEIVEVEREEVS